MLPVTGYVDRWSVRPGETIRFMVSRRGGGPFRARLARIFCGDPNPRGPGYREEPVPCGLDGEHAGIEQPVRPGSRAVVPWLDPPPGDGLSIALTLKATRLAATAPQCVLHWGGPGGEIRLDIEARRLVLTLGGPGGSCRLSLPENLTESWTDVALTLDSASGRAGLAARARPLPYCPRPAIVAAAGSAMLPDFDGGPLTFASSLDRDACFDGRIEAPIVHAEAWAPETLLDAQSQPLLRPTAFAAWDFSREMGTDHILDTGIGCFHGLLENLPTRAVAGASWSGRHHRWTEAPSEYGAIHFHSDDIGDLGWEPSLALAVPDGWPSGLYALHLETAEGRDNIPFVIRSRQAGASASIALMLPTLTYQVYGQYPRPEILDESLPRAAEWNALMGAAHQHPEYGLSAYNNHADGSGVAMVSMRRPMIDKRVDQIHRLDRSPGGSGLYWLAADTYILDWLDRRGIPCEVITDHDVHAEGAPLLRRYAAILTGQHPEYHTPEAHSAIATYLEGGGRLLYLGGNGFYWKIVAVGPSAWAVELRRAEGGVRTWAAAPGEGYHAVDGSYGGLWRRLGKPPQALVGVGFTSQGGYVAEPYRFTDAIDDPRLAFLREGLGEARPGASFGERGHMGGGAAGHEIDRADPRLGTPAHALVLASCVPVDPSFEPANEERLTHEWPGPREEVIRSDIVFFETAAGGAVLSVGSMSFIGALPIDGYGNLTARLMENAVRRFADPAPFAWPSRGDDGDGSEASTLEPSSHA